MHSIITLGLCFATAVNAARVSAEIRSTAVDHMKTVAPQGAIIVDASGEPTIGKSYKTVQAGIDALVRNSPTEQYIFIYPGTYFEQVFIPYLNSSLIIQGYTKDASSYKGNTATITYNLSKGISGPNGSVGSNDLSATLRQWNNNTKIYNINVENTFGHPTSVDSQNLAIAAQNNNQGYYGMQFIGYQDTILAQQGNQLYANSLVVGAIDFIFGQFATAWFENVDIRCNGQGSVTASGRIAADSTSWYVINNSNIDRINSSIPVGNNNLGRPWKEYARVSVQNTEMSDVIASVGWIEWNKATPNTEFSTLAEYNNSGAGSVGPRANFSVALTKPISIQTVLGDAYENDWYVDMSYMQTI